MAGINMAVASIAMTSEEMDDIVERIAHRLRHEDGNHFKDIPPEQHVIHHQWTEMQMALDKTKVERNEAIIRIAQQWSVVAILSGAVAAFVAWWKGNHGG